MLGIAAVYALTSPLGGDYAQPGCTRAYNCDDPAVSIRALAHGDLKGFFDLQPTMGAVSLLLRVPFAAIGRLLDNSDLTLYRLGVFACLAATGLVGIWLAATARRRVGVSLVTAAALALGFVLNPVTSRTLFWGHPEETIGAALLCAAAASAYLGRWRSTAVLLALAFSTKQWAALAAPLILLLVPLPKRIAFVGLTAVIVAVLTIPMFLGDQGRFRQANERLVADSARATPTNIWWQQTVPAKTGYTGDARLPASFPQKVSHPLIVATALLLPLLWWRLGWSLLGLLPTVMLLRCVFDPGSYSYYHDPFFMGVLTFEVFALRRFPYAAAAAAGLLQLTIWLSPHISADALQVLYLAWTLPFIAYIARASALPRARQTLFSSLCS